MDRFATSHFSHDALVHDLKSLDGRDRMTTAVLLSRVAEFEERKLFLREGYPSMYDYCVEELRWCEGTASRRIYAARAARRFPLLLVAIADGRLHLTAVLMLAKYLTSGNVDELVAAATHRSKAGVERLIAERFPRPDLPERLEAIAPPFTAQMLPSQVCQHSLENVHAVDTLTTPWSVQHSPENVHAVDTLTTPWSIQHSPENVHAVDTPTTPWSVQHSPENAGASVPQSRVTPLSPERFGLWATLDREAYDFLQRARELLGHRNPRDEIAPVLKQALALLVGQLEKQKYAAAERPRTSSQDAPEAAVNDAASGNPRDASSQSEAAGPRETVAGSRHIPAAVKRAVRERDGEQCTFVSENGRRCPARRMLEFDHIEPVACGGASTVANVHLVCRAHNQHAAERAFGIEFMERKRAEARREFPARRR